MIAIDTNLLVYAHRQRVPQHQAAQAAIEQACLSQSGWGFSQPALAEFWGIVTHPSSEGRASTPTEARAFLEALVEADAQIWLPRPDYFARFTQLAEDLAIQGPRIFDLQIALIAFENGAHELWTHDHDFVRLPGLRVHDPLRH